MTRPGPRCRELGQRGCVAMHGVGHLPLAVDADGNHRWWRHAPDMDLVRMALAVGLECFTVDGQPLRAMPHHLTGPDYVLIPEHTVDLLVAQAVESIEKEHRDHQPQRPE